METLKIKFYINNEEVFAVFVDQPQPNGFYLSYAKLGQHSDCHIDYIWESREATLEEYRPLREELIKVYDGYVLDCLNEDQPVQFDNIYLDDLIHYLEDKSFDLDIDNKLRLLNTVFNPYLDYNYLTSSEGQKLKKILSDGSHIMQTF